MACFVVVIYSLLMYGGVVFTLNLLDDIFLKEDMFYFSLVHLSIITAVVESRNMINFKAGLFLFGTIYIIDLLYCVKVFYSSYKRFLKEEGDC